MFILFHENVYFKLGSASKVFSKRTPSMVILSWMAFKVAGITSGVNLNSMVDKYPRARPEWYTNLTSALGISRTSWRTRVSVIIPDVSDLEIKIKLIGGKKIGFGFVLSRFSGQGPQKPKNFGKKPKHFGIRKPQHFRQGSLKTRNISVQELWEPKYFRFKNPQNPKISGLFRFLHILVKSCSYQDQGFYIQNLKIQKKESGQEPWETPKPENLELGQLQPISGSGFSGQEPRNPKNSGSNSGFISDFLHTLPGRWLRSQPPWGYHYGLHGVVVVAVANHGGAVAPLIAVVDHGHNHVVDDHHLVPGYKQGPDLKKLKIKHQNQIQKTKQNGDGNGTGNHICG